MDVSDEMLQINDQSSAVEMAEVLGRSNRQYEPEALLCVAMLLDARDTLRYGDDHKRMRDVKREAIEWFRGSGGAISFEQCCDILHFNADAVRERILYGPIKPKQYNWRGTQRKIGYGRNGVVPSGDS